MRIPNRRQLCVALLIGLLQLAPWWAAGAQSGASSAAPAQAAGLAVNGDVKNPLSLSLDALKRMPRKMVNVKNEHGQEDEVYEGVPLAALLKQAGAPTGGQIRGKAMATYVLAEGADGYQVLFALPELDSDFQDSEVLVADTFDGKPINDKLGPLRLVVPHDKRPARWVRMLQSIKVVSLNGASPSAAPEH
jgi:DMSO/TMAO reductase YedYZ molybdopterin-dependent catalytic subunit